MAYKYHLLNEHSSNGRRLASFLWWAIRAAAVILLTLLVAFIWWLQSDLRQLGAAINAASCSAIPWYYFPTSQARYLLDGQDYYLPPANNSNSSEYSASAESQSGFQRVAHIQACSVADAGSAYLRLLLDNHQQYCRETGIEYVLRTGEGHGPWLKEIALKEKLEQELKKVEAERVHWIFLSDVDSLFVNPMAKLSNLLPPSNIDADPFLLITEDYKGLNTGAFFLKVDVRSLQFVNDILAFDRNDPRLRFYEQSAIAILLQEQGLVESKAAVLMPQNIFNSYDGIKAFGAGRESILIHWPSRKFKRDAMVPELEMILQGNAPHTSRSQLLAGKKAFEAAANQFWRSTFGRRATP